MAEMKVSEMLEAESVNDEDILMIVQNGVNKKVKAEKVGTGKSGADTLPIGAIMPYPGETPPTNWLLCNGQAINRETYSKLFKLIGTTYGVGDGSTTFNLPDLRGRVPVGLDSNDTDFDTLGETGGEKNVRLGIEHIPSHTHIARAAAVGSPSGYGDGFIGLTNSYTQDPGFATGPTGGDQAHNNLQPYIVQNYIIKAFQSSGVVANVVQAKSNSTTDVYSCDYINKAIQVNKETNNEVATNEYIDGKRVYCKRIETTITEDSGIVIPCGLPNISYTPIKWEGYIYNPTTGAFFEINTPRGSMGETISRYQTHGYWETNNNRFVVQTNDTRVGSKVTLELYYIKNS